MRFILKTSPRHVSEDVPLDKRIEVAFMVDLNPAKVSTETVTLFNMDTHFSVPIQIRYKRKELHITPLEKLEPLMHYQVSITGGKEGVEDIIGRHMPDSHVFEFYTADTDDIKPPQILSPTNLSEIYGDVSFEWYVATGAHHYELQISDSHTFHQVLWPTEPTKVYDNWFTPDMEYVHDTTYYARMRSVKEDGTKSAYSEPIQYYYDAEGSMVIAGDIEGKEIESLSEEEAQAKQVLDENQGPARQRVMLRPNTRMKKESQLTALQSHFSTKSTLAEALYIKESTPKHQALHLGVNEFQEIVIEFSEEIDPSTVDKNNFYLVAERN